MFEHRTEAEMRLYSEKLAKELALKRRRQTESDGAIAASDDVVDPPSRADEAHTTTETTIPTDPEGTD